MRDLTSIDPQTRIVVLTGYGSIATAVEAMRLGAANYLPKPADADEIIAAFERGRGAAAHGAGSEPIIPRPAWRAPSGSTSTASWPTAGGNICEAARRLGLHRRTAAAQAVEVSAQPLITASALGHGVVCGGA